MGNEKNTVGNPKLDWVKNISLEDLKKTYRNSVYLRWVGNILRFFAAAVSFTLLFQYLVTVSYTRLGFYYGAYSIAGLFLFVLSLLLNKIKAAQWVRNIFHIVQWIFALITLYCVVCAICLSPLGNYFLSIFGRGDVPLKPSARVISDSLKLIAHCLVFCIVMVTTAAVFRHDRSTGARIFLIPASLVWTAAGITAIFGMDILTFWTTIFFFFLMPFVFWIAVRNRNSLFGSCALSHQQLSSVLEQKKKNVQENEIVIPEDHNDIFKQKTYLRAAWFCFAVSVLYLLYINIAQ